MSKHLEAIQKRLQGTSIRATAEAMGRAVALTDDEFVMAKAKLFSVSVERVPLDTLSGLRTIPNPSANLLEIDFSGPPPRSVTVMYGPEAQADFERIITLLQQHLDSVPEVGK